MTEKADFHGHPILHPSYDAKFGLQEYTRIALAKGITLPPITNFGDEDRFSDFYEDGVPKDWSKEQFNGGFVVYDRTGKLDGKETVRRAIYLRSQEVPTKEGHLLVVGTTKNLVSGKSLEDTLKRAEDENAIIIADHPLIPAIRGGLGRVNVLKYHNRLHALETNSQATNMLGRFSFGLFKQKPNNELAYYLAVKAGLPVVANSDFHMSYLSWLPYLHGQINTLGIAYNEFTELGKDSSNWINEIKHVILTSNFERHHEYVSGLELFKWQVPVLISQIRDKINKKQGKSN